MIDLSSLQFADTYVMPVIHPSTGMHIDGMTVTLKSKHSPEWKAKVSELARNAPKTAKPDLERSEKIGTELLSVVVVDWTGFEENGKPVKCSRDAAKDLMTRYPWLRKQIDAAVDEDTNFLQGALTA
jgi:hypothetical protein